MIFLPTFPSAYICSETREIKAPGLLMQPLVATRPIGALQGEEVL